MVPQVQSEASVNIKNLDSILTTRKETQEAQYKAAIEILNSLPPPAQKEYKRSGITPEEAFAHFDIFMNCLHFIVRRHVADSPVFQKQNQRMKEYHKHPKRAFSNQDLEKLFSHENPKNLFKHKTFIGHGGFGDVFIAEKKADNTKVAIKIMKKKAYRRYLQYCQ